MLDMSEEQLVARGVEPVYSSNASPQKKRVARKEKRYIATIVVLLVLVIGMGYLLRMSTLDVGKLERKVEMFDQLTATVRINRLTDKTMAANAH